MRPFHTEISKREKQGRHRVSERCWWRFRCVHRSPLSLDVEETHFPSALRLRLTDNRYLLQIMTEFRSQTLGTLKGASAKVTMPSTLTYKERRALADHDPVEYHRYVIAIALSGACVDKRSLQCLRALCAALGALVWPMHSNWCNAATQSTHESISCFPWCAHVRSLFDDISPCALSHETPRGCRVS
jgi:hypothetical protein